MQTSWKYELPVMSDQLAPFIRIKVKNPLREQNIPVKALVDTGYDGFVAISEKEFLVLGLDEFEIPSSKRPLAETYGGDSISLRCSTGEVVVEGLESTLMGDIDGIKGAHEVLVGRNFIENYLVLLDGPKTSIKIIIGTNTLLE